MKKLILSGLLLASSVWAFSQTTTTYQYADDFSNDFGAPAAQGFDPAPPAGMGITFTHQAGSGVVVMTGDGSGATYKSEPYLPYDNPYMSGANASGANLTIDMSGTDDTIFVIAKSSVPNTLLRIDIQDNNKHTSNYGDASNQVNELSVPTTWTLLKYRYPNPQEAYSGIPGCTTTTPCPVDKLNIQTLLFSINGATGGFNGTVTLDYLQIGGSSATVASNRAALNNVASSNLYPNPASDVANVQLSLKSVANVKVTLTDLMGKEVKVIAEGTTNNVDAKVDVAGLTKGVYTVNYFVDGAAAKSQLLMVK